MTRCLSCSEPLGPGERDYHAACIRELFGIDRLPAIDADLARLHTLALAMAGRVSVSGMQRKSARPAAATRGCTVGADAPTWKAAGALVLARE